jgi:uncharacterized protein (DUF2267 family)
MADTGFSAFSTTVEKSNLVLKEIEEAYGWPPDRRQQSYDALRSVLHALRDRLTVEEAADFGAQLPMLLRGLYYEGWKPSKVPQKMSKEEFVDRIRREFTFDIDGGIETLVKTVLDALRRYVTEGEWDEVRSSMPKDLQTLVSA